MSKKRAKTIAMTPGFEKPEIGWVVAVRAVDWGMETSQYPSTAGFTIVRGTLYGRVIVCNDEWITLAPQVFDGGDVRCALSIPWVTVEQVTILEKDDDE